MSSQPSVAMWGWRTLLIALAVGLAIGELADAFFIESPLVAIVVGVLFLAGAFWIVRGGIGGVLLVGVLAVIEVVVRPFYERNDTGDWIVQVLFFVASLIGLIVAIAIVADVLRRRRSRFASLTSGDSA